VTGLTGFKRTAASGAQWCAIGLGFFIPISAALDNALTLAFILLVLLSGDLTGKWRLLCKHPVALAALAFAAIILAGMMWSDAPAEQLRESLADALRFAILGVFALVFLDPSTRDRAQFAFLLSSTLILALSFILWSGLVDAIPGLKGRPDYPVVFKYHITHNLLMAAAALLFALHAMDARTRAARILFSTLACCAALNVFLLVPGRTGQLALAAGLSYLWIARFKWRGLALATVMGIALAAAGTLAPGSVLHERSAKAWQELSAWKRGEAQPESSSVGLRLEFYSNAVEMFAEHPIIGVGSGAFRTAYEAKVRGTQMLPADHPHNAFLHTGIELGLIGLGVLLALLAVQWRSAGSLGFTERAAARGLVVIFAAGSLVSSSFSDHAEGLFYAWASGLLFANVRSANRENA
jgi:O-antigen ligase